MIISTLARMIAEYNEIDSIGHTAYQEMRGIHDSLQLSIVLPSFSADWKLHYEITNPSTEQKKTAYHTYRGEY